MTGFGDATGLAQTAVPTTPARALDTVFTPSAARPALVVYSLRVSLPGSLTTAQTGRVELRSDANNPPATVRAQMRMSKGGGIDATVSTDESITYLVPAGHRVLLATVTESGTPAFSLTSQTETVL